MTATDRETIVYDVSGLAAPSVGTVDGLARLQLKARRSGYEIKLCRASSELRELLDFMGLADVLRVEPGGEPEEREDRVRVEEERELDDLPG
jgi:hypothetical protein